MATDPQQWMAANSAGMLSPQLQARFAELQQVTDPNDPRNGPNARTPVQQEQITKNLGQFFTPEMRRGLYNKQQTTPGLFGGRSLTGRLSASRFLYPLKAKALRGLAALPSAGAA